MNIELYEKAAKLAYANSLDLLKDANILFSHRRYARAFALGVLSCEEFTKAFLYKCVACGIIIDKNYYRDLRLHDLKLYHFIELITSNYAWRRIDGVRKKTSVYDQKFKDHSKHIFTKELDKIEDDVTQHVLNIINAFSPINELKFRALYVDVLKNEVLIPKNFMKKSGCNAFLAVLQRYLHGFDVILSTDEKKFRKVVEMLDPDILSGTLTKKRG
ncbi:MAG: AbiV family abortive infection protein [Nitrososphaerales archaeon]